MIYVSWEKISYLVEVQRLNKSSLGRERKKKEKQIFSKVRFTVAEAAFVSKGALAFRTHYRYYQQMRAHHL